MTTNKLTRLTGRIVTYVLVVAGAVVMIFPFIWTVSTSLKADEQITLRELQLVPNPVVWQNYTSIFLERVPGIFLYLRNTMILVVASEFGAIVVCSLVGYAFARIPFPGRDALFVVMLSTMMMPYVAFLVPRYLMFDRLGWVPGFLPLIVPRLLGHNPFWIFLYRQSFRCIPESLFDAARIDGCSEFGLWWRIAMPISKPILITMAVFAFQFVWNAFLYPLMYLGGEKELWTLGLALNALTGMEGQMRWLNTMMVMAVYMMVPTLAMFAAAQKHLVKGVTVPTIGGGAG